MQGNFLMEFKKKDKYTCPNRFGQPVLGYESVFVDPARCLNYVNYLQAQELNLQQKLPFGRPDSEDPRARQPGADEDDYAETMAEHQAFLKFQEVWNECGLVKADFSLVVDCISQLLGEDLFSYLCARQNDLELRSRCLYRFDDGQVAYECSLGEKYVGPMVPVVIESSRKSSPTGAKRNRQLEGSSRSSQRRPGQTSLPTRRSRLPTKRTSTTCLRDRTTTSSRKRSLISFPVQK